MVNNWQVNGLRGTASWGFEAAGLFIPKHRTYDPAATPRARRGARTGYRLAAFCVGIRDGGSGCGAGCAGCGEGACEPEGSGNLDPATPLLRDWSTTQRQVGEAEAIWHSARAFLREAAGAVWNKVAAGKPLTMGERIHMRLASTHANRKATDVVDIAYTLCGSSAIFESNPVQRRFRMCMSSTSRCRGDCLTMIRRAGISWGWIRGATGCSSRIFILSILSIDVS